jgi:superfamily II DNA or RNA helicase
VSNVTASTEELHRALLTVLSLKGPLSRSAWSDLAGAAGIIDGRGKALYGPPFKEVVETLVGSGAVVEVHGGNYGVTFEAMYDALDWAAKARRLTLIAARLASARKYFSFGGSSVYGRESLGPIADMRRAVAAGDADALGKLIEGLASMSRYEPWDWVHALGHGAPRAWIDRLPPLGRDGYLVRVLDEAFIDLAPVGKDVLDAACASESSEVRGRAAVILAMRGAPDEADRVVPKGGEGDRWERGAAAFTELTRGAWGEARRLFARASTGARGQIVEPPSWLVVFALLAAVTDETLPAVDELRRVEKAEQKLKAWPLAHAALEQIAAYRASGRSDRVAMYPGTRWFEVVLTGLASTWVDSRVKAYPNQRDPIPRLRTRAASSGFPWVVRQLDAVSGATSAADDPTDLRALHVRRAAWELGLEALQGAVLAQVDAGSTGTATAPIDQLVWQVGDVEYDGEVEIEPFLLSGRSRVGKRVSVARLASRPDVPLEERDRAILQALLVESSRWSRAAPARLLGLLAGHPRVRDKTGKPLTVVEREPELRVESASGGARVTMHPSVFDESGTTVRREGNTLAVVRLTPAAARLKDVLGEAGLVVPKQGLSRLHQVIASLGGAIAVRASEQVAGEVTQGDPRPVVQLFRHGGGLRARLRVLPAGAAGAALRPGQPPLEIVVGDDAGLRRVLRDLSAERLAEASLLTACPVLSSLPLEGDDRIARELDVALEMLLELREASVNVQWPEGQPLRAPAIRTDKQVRVRVEASGDWLELQGDVRLDEGRVLEMRELLTAASKAKGRFIPLGDDQFLALTADLLRKLEALARVQELASRRGEVSAALLPAIEGWVEGLDVTWSGDVQRRREALTKAESSTPRVPTTLAAELRDYQRDGFTFLARRADAGLGSCLADDMGLGKTVQALALLLHRAPHGPALVVAPTSVCHNWEQEASRFAPTLRVVRLADADREEAVRDARPGDVLLASYGVVVASDSVLASRRFATLIFDEAHALKNAATRRWKSARALRADAIVALTGTPVENHVGELHAILDVLVPGMLGPRAAFERGFGAALADGSHGAVTTLRRIVRPFVMRRTKAQVLEELPPKTEMTRIIEPSPEHAAFYEAARRRAAEQVEAAATGGAHARIQILAEITRLRRSAIDPRLVAGDSAPAGAKLDALVELVRELRQEGHRALIFSQFLEVLDFAKGRLEAENIACRRLDGTMSASARAAEVEAFQSGQGDVFLLSLKAGGVGMNLTGADFVVHLDPWWNPAVEDQATDRAHRIGQTRPVTIVRLVTGGTIEEKVLALHGAKRKLYDDVVGAADGGGTLDSAALSELLGAASGRTPKSRTVEP